MWSLEAQQEHSYKVLVPSASAAPSIQLLQSTDYETTCSSTLNIYK